MRRAGKTQRRRAIDQRALLVVGLGMLVIGLSLWPEAHIAVQHVTVGLERGLAGVVLLLGVAGAVRRAWRRPH